MLKTGVIIKIVSNQYTVKIDNEIITCNARGKFRNDKIIPLVGDICKIDYENKYILEILERKNYLNRPMVANIDCALVVTSVKEPDINLNLLDKMISNITINKIEPILCFSKIDLLNNNEKKELKKILAYYKKIGYKVVTNKQTRKINKILKNKIVVITGQTGAGKSTLLNKLNKKLSLKTDEISYALGRGKHTTRHVELYPFKNYYVADTPGFSSLDFQNVTNEEIRDSFIEFNDYNCQFKNCFHNKENNCGVKNALDKGLILKSRHDNYLNFINNKG